MRGSTHDMRTAARCSWGGARRDTHGNAQYATPGPCIMPAVFVVVAVAADAAAFAAALTFAAAVRTATAPSSSTARRGRTRDWVAGGMGQETNHVFCCNPCAGLTPF
eukprot:9353178-Pyramimonas_sp.AAC.1